MRWLQAKVSRMVRVYGSPKRSQPKMKAVKELMALIRSKKPTPEKIDNPLKFVLIPFVKHVVFPAVRGEDVYVLVVQLQ